MVKVLTTLPMRTASQDESFAFIAYPNFNSVLPEKQNDTFSGRFYIAPEHYRLL
jgi:hypothetical protein